MRAGIFGLSNLLRRSLLKVNDYDRDVMGNFKESIAYAQKGNSSLDDNEYRKAVKEFSKALKVNPVNVEACNGLGIAYAFLEKKDKAIPAFKKAAEINPDDPEAYFNLAVVYTSLNKYEQAVICYQKVINISPDDTEALKGLGMAYEFLVDYRLAVLFYRKAIAEDPEDAEIYFRLGVACSYLEEDKEAKKNFLKAKELFKKQGDIKRAQALGKLIGA